MRKTLLSILAGIAVVGNAYADLGAADSLRFEAESPAIIAFAAGDQTVVSAFSDLGSQLIGDHNPAKALKNGTKTPKNGTKTLKNGT